MDRKKKNTANFVKRFSFFKTKQSHYFPVIYVFNPGSKISHGQPRQLLFGTVSLLLQTGPFLVLGRINGLQRIIWGK